jgi:Zn-dependent protease with chaperone function/Zn-finger nucleic acid-binding protein
MEQGTAGLAPRKTLFEVEREKRWRIWALFGLLLIPVFVSVWAVCFLANALLLIVLPDPHVGFWVLSPAGILTTLGISLLVALLYWSLAKRGARRRLIAALHCEALDPGDTYHQRLADIVEEMRLASGAPRIECVTVRAGGLNAFAFSDLDGGAVVGVTEGALARLSRQQLQAVVAQEFAHILSGSYVTVTVSCLLFGIYSSLAEDLDDAVDTPALGGYGIAGAIVLLVWIRTMQLASAVVGRALSRQRELQADAAAAIYTRDPLSLAEALRILDRSLATAGYIPEGLAPLCILNAGSNGQSGVSWHDTHPPLDERIAKLLEIANIPRGRFELQAAQADDEHLRREHVTQAPGAGSIGSGVVASGLAPLGPLAPHAARTPLAPRAAGGSDVGSAAGLAMTCPGCGASLSQASYEGVDISVCRACGGRLVSGSQVRRILARREMAFTEEQRQLAETVAADGDRLRRAAIAERNRGDVRRIACPRCGAATIRQHYDYDYAVEIDHCIGCDLYWFDKDELEALQVLVERQGA